MLCSILGGAAAHALGSVVMALALEIPGGKVKRGQVVACAAFRSAVFMLMLCCVADDAGGQAAADGAPGHHERQPHTEQAERAVVTLRLHLPRLVVFKGGEGGCIAICVAAAAHSEQQVQRSPAGSLSTAAVVYR